MEQSRGAGSRGGRNAMQSSTFAIVRELKAFGYRYVTVDLQGYRMGSLNEGLPLRPA